MTSADCVLLAGVVLSACSAEAVPSSRLLITDEVRERLTVKGDSFPEITSTRAGARAEETALAAIVPFGFSGDSSCVQVFRAKEGLLVYVSTGCYGGKRVALVADGDALVRLNPSGDSVLGTLLAPGGVDIESH